MRRLAAAALLAAVSSPALAQVDTMAQLRSELAQARAEIVAQRQQLDQQESRLRALETRMASTAAPAGSITADAPVRTAQNGVETVGAAPADYDRPPEVAVLGDQGSVITRAGQLTVEASAEYTRADRNRAVFRGIEVVESVLVGVFDINESRQDILTAALALRYGLSGRFEFGARLPFVHRSDTSILAPIAGSTNNDPARTIDSSAQGTGIGDLELSARYQLTKARAGQPFLIANLQGVLPTGTSPFSVPRDELGRALKAATGAGFYGISPSVTAILPSDPVVLFGTLGYTFNLGRHVNTRIPPVQIDYVDPGDAINATAGIGIAFNQRATINLGYAHSWAFGTLTRMRTEDAQTGALGPSMSATSRDLQIGRLLFGVTYRLNDRESVNWAVEVGATDDAPDVRTTIRVPLVLLTGR
jgi:hypothetical protein